MNNNTRERTEPTTDPGRPPLLMAHESSEMRPVLRVYTLGPLTLEWVGTATPFPAERLVSRGAAPALLLLKALISRPHRYAARDWLCEHLHSAEEDTLSPGRLDDLASLLRGLLCPPIEDRMQRDRLRRELLCYVHSASESGPGYRLGSYPLIWVDLDALAWYIEQACRLERFGEDALPVWERAYALAKRGAYLEEEPYSDWAERRRAEAARYLRQSVHALARLYLAQPEARAEEEALRLLGDYCQQHLEDEDALRPLMELLGRHERYQEALSYYERLCAVLEEEGRTPDARTSDLKEFLRTKQLQRSRALPQQRGHMVVPIERLPRVSMPEQPAWLPLPTHWQSVIPHHHMLNLLDTLPNDHPDHQQLGAWLTLAVNDLTALFNAGWTMEDVLDALHMTLQAVQDMPPVVRKKLFQLSSVALIGRIAQPTGDALSEEEQTQLCISLGQNIAESWKVFHTTKPSLMLAIAQVQLSFVKHVHTLLYPAVRPFFYAALHQLIGASLYLLGSFEQAHHALEQSYLTGLQVANAWHMAQSLSWQAYLWQERGTPARALDAIDQALRLISSQDGLECLRLRARLLALSAEQTALMGDVSGTQERLQASEAFLVSLAKPHEEFDAIGWLQQAGICALYLHDYPLAIQRLQCALDQIPSQWILRSIATAIPLAKALTRANEVGKAIEVAQRAIPLITSAQASVFTRKFVTYLKQDLLKHFPDDRRCQRLVIEARHQLEKQWDSR